MATNAMSTLPPGFVLDEQPNSLPPGFVLDPPNQSMSVQTQPVDQPYTGLTAWVTGQGPDMTAMERVADIGKSAARSAGVATRNVLEGIEGTVDFLGMPIRAGAQAMGFNDPAGGASDLTDSLGLPQPSGKTERILSEAEKLLAGGGGMVGAAQKLSQGSNIAKAMSTRPDMQLTSMIGAGTAGGTVKEEGGGPWAQLAASLAGGLAAPAAFSGAQRTVQAGKNIVDSMRNAPNLNVKMDAVIDAALNAKGIQGGALSSAVRNQLHEDMKKSLQTGEINPDIVRRLIDYRLTGATPTAGPVSLDPGVITRQKNLSALGASSNDPKLQQLSQIENKNVKTLIENLNRVGAESVDDSIAAGEKVLHSLDEIAASAKGKIDPLYQQARNTVGRSAHLDGHSFTNRASDLLDDALVGGKLPADVRNKLNSIAKGEMPLTVDVSEQLKTTLFQLGKSTADKQERMALRLVRQALEETPLLQGQGKAAIEAFRVAREANRQWMSVVEKTPALKAAMDNIDPDKFMNTYIIGQGKNASVESVTNLRNVIKDDPGAITVVKNYMARYLKERGTVGSADELGKFSQSGYNKALQAIGDRKLKLFFNEDEYQLLKAIGRVASYEQSQPVGSAVNNSKTAAAAMSNMLDWLGNVQLLRRIPFGAQIIGNPAKSISQNIQATQVMKLPEVAAQPAKQPRNMMPYIASGLAAGSAGNRRDDDRGN